MNYIERTIRSAPGLTQEQAFDSLQSHPNFKSGTKIASLRRRGERWVAVLNIPKFASEDGGEEGPPKPPKAEGGEGEGDEEGSENPFGDLGGPPDPMGEEKPGKSGKPGEGGKGGTEHEMLHVLTEILHALTGGPAGPGMGGPDDLGPGADPMGGPPPHGGGLPGGAPKPGGGGMPKPMKPGESPPGMMPVGAPTFASTHPLAAHIAKLAGRKRTIAVSSPAGLTIKQAKTELDPIANQYGYRVAQVSYCGAHCSCKTPGSNKIHALLAIQ